MPTFANTQEMQSILEELFQRAQHTDAARAIGKANMAACFVYTDPSVRLVMDGRNSTEERPIDVTFGEGGPTPDVTFTLNADVGHRFWCGKLNVPQALSRGQIKATGSIAKALKLLPLMPTFYELYREIMTERGRGGDLL